MRCRLIGMTALPLVEVVAVGAVLMLSAVAGQLAACRAHLASRQPQLVGGSHLQYLLHGLVIHCLLVCQDGARFYRRRGEFAWAWFSLES